MALNNFNDVKNLFNTILTNNGELAGAVSSPHKNFWSTLSYHDFVNGTVPGVPDPSTGQFTIPILVKGNAATSNLILALKGEGPLFDPNTGAFGQMPANGPPMFTAAQIQEIADYIDAGCPE